MPANRADPTRLLNDTSSYQRCFVCGQRNREGLQTRFWMEGQDIVTEFLPSSQHQGFPGVTHGGIIAALLDETLGRTGVLEGEWMMTGRFALRFRAPAPIGQPVRVCARIVRKRKGAVEAAGEAALKDGTVVAEATGVFVRLPPPLLAQAVRAHPELAEYFSK